MSGYGSAGARGPTSLLVAIGSFLGLVGAVFVPALISVPRGLACTLAAVPLEQRVREADLIVVGTVSEFTPSSLAIEVEAFLKGPVAAGTVRVAHSEQQGQCDAGFPARGERVLVMLTSDRGQFRWPVGGRAWRLDSAPIEDPDGPFATGEELVGRVRAITNQYAVPAATQEEGAGIDWVGTVLPIGGVLVGLMAAGLVLMRVWHRIDPS